MYASQVLRLKNTKPCLPEIQTLSPNNKNQSTVSIAKLFSCIANHLTLIIYLRLVNKNDENKPPRNQLCNLYIKPSQSIINSEE